MDDEKIIALYWARSEAAIWETANKYNRYCYTIAYSILKNNEDSEECVNDTYMRAWEAIPPKRPNRLSTFLGKITRNLSLNRYERYTAKKRGSGQLTLALDELKECIPAGDNTNQAMDEVALTEIFNGFLAALPADTRKIFMRRYWYFSSVKEIAADYHFSESKIKMILLRTRNELKQILLKEGVIL